MKPDGVYITTQPTPDDKLAEWEQKLMPNQKAKVILLQSNAQDLVYLTRQIEAGKIKTVIDRTYPLSEIADAHAYSETEHAAGKIAIKVRLIQHEHSSNGASHP